MHPPKIEEIFSWGSSRGSNFYFTVYSSYQRVEICKVAQAPTPQLPSGSFQNAPLTGSKVCLMKVLNKMQHAGRALDLVYGAKYLIVPPTKPCNPRRNKK